MLNIGRTRFLTLLRDYQQSPATLCIIYGRGAPARLSARADAAIEVAVLQEKELVDDPQLAISEYNYAALRGRPAGEDITVSATTITDLPPKECESAHGCRRASPHAQSRLTVVCSSSGRELDRLDYETC